MLKFITSLIFIVFTLAAFAVDLDSKRPLGIKDEMWTSFKTSLQETRLSPNPEGLGSTGEF